MNKWYFWLSLFVLQLLSAGLSRAQVTDYYMIYASRDLSGHLVDAECNPGGGTSCPCSSSDVSISSFETYGAVTSNVRRVNTYVNAIGYKKFEETFPNGDSIALGVYKYVGYIRLPVIPHADLTQEQNAQAVHFMIQVWDGRGSLLNSNDSSYEGTIYWELNPWAQPKGKIMIYTDSTNSAGDTLTETGLTLPPDTLWHRFEIIIDLTTRKYVSVSIDDSTRSLNYQLHRVHHPDWGNDISLIITTESLATWPQTNCSYVFTWTTYFKDLAFYRKSTSPPSPTLASPSDGMPDMPTNPTLVWNASPGADSYRLQVSRYSDFSPPAFDLSGITSTSQQITSLANKMLYYWRVNATNAGGTSDWSPFWSFTTNGLTSVEQLGSDIPTTYALHQNYPNPFNPVTTIQFSLPEQSYVKLTIFNSLGMQIAVLVNEHLPPGHYRTQWIPRGIPSGVYFYQLRSSEFTDTKKLLLLR